jgi:hypothetical protein
MPSPAPVPATAPVSPGPKDQERPGSPAEGNSGGSDADSGRGKLKRSKSGKILRSFLSTYIPSANSNSSLASSSSAFAGERPNQVGSSEEVPTKKTSLIKKRCVCGNNDM